ncbi:hypothetical protein PAECIP111891_02505 [Paenibacillus allorhizoplanae]|uniref:DUF4190 domain-containing protein n=1 Tax=Paenibacillus allorhizoplanae TaxID=2905648 RepID=A0ABM9C563_9BACL|nr:MULTISPECIES: hypothetical protein [Paenibacillus]KRE74950.1 hypothetical protein ASL11_03380 [Paenibacillus sp. Soil750]CAH1204427.1 hypothetical protein PAECIP111891_02505 [Paenibacillus allorhizoplanae]
MNKEDSSLDNATKERFQKSQLHLESGLHAQEEYAAEIAVPQARISRDYKSSSTSTVSDEEVAELVEAVTRNKAVGYVALFVALASLFVWPVLLGISGIILGVIAFVMGNKSLGSWSVALGFIAVAAYFLLIPYYS